MTAQRNITDRGLRYRANKNMPDHAAVCVFCGLPWVDQTGARPVLEVGHLDGNESHDTPDNLSWTCRACNVAAGVSLRKEGRGRLTNQFNPSKSGGAKSLGQWLQAVGAITPHVDRGERGLVSDMNVADAVAMIRATPHSKRSEFASRLRSSRRGRGNPSKKENLFGFGKALAPRNTTPAHGGIAARLASPKQAKAATLATHRGYAIHKTGDGEFYSDLDPSSWFSTAAGAKKHIDWYLKTRGNPGIPDADAARAFVGRQRKDGKYPVQFVYPSSGRRISKLLSQADLDALKAEGSYNVYASSRNPSAFDRCVESVESRGGARDARAVCAAAGRKKYGQAEMTRRAVAGKRKAARKNPATVAEWKRDFYDQGFSAGLKDKGAEYPSYRGNQVIEQGRFMAQKLVDYYGVPASKLREIGGEFGRGYYDAKSGKRRKRPNPAGAADSVFEEFHGHAPDETLHVVSTRHHHEHLAAAGELRKLVVDGVDGKEHTVTGFDGAVLAFNEDKNQLFIVGGDQSINLEDFSIKEVHEIETLGDVRKIDYFTTKDHLGDEGGEAVYTHTFRTTNENGKHVTVRIARYPQLIYRVREQALEFSGGSYYIRAEGIDL